MGDKINKIMDEPLTLTIEKEFPVAIEQLWDAWKGETISSWACPEGFHISKSKSELKPGGSYRICMVAPDGKKHWVGGTYRQVQSPNLIAFTHLWDETPDQETYVTIAFEEVSKKKTKMIFNQTCLVSQKVLDDHNSGWEESFAKLEKLLKG